MLSPQQARVPQLRPAPLTPQRQTQYQHLPRLPCPRPCRWTRSRCPAGRFCVWCAASWCWRTAPWPPACIGRRGRRAAGVWRGTQPGCVGMWGLQGCGVIGARAECCACRVCAYGTSTHVGSRVRPHQHMATNTPWRTATCRLAGEQAAFPECQLSCVSCCAGTGAAGQRFVCEV